MKSQLYHFAALISASEIGFDGPQSDNGVSHGILNAVYFWAGVVAVIIIIVAGFMYTTANGDSSQLTKAKNAIFGAVIGLVIVMLAFTITSIILGGF